MKTAACGPMAGPDAGEDIPPAERTAQTPEYPPYFSCPDKTGRLPRAFGYANAAKCPCDFNGTKQAPAGGLLPFDKINLKKIDNVNMFLRVSLGGNINNRDGTQTNIPNPIPIVILDYDHVLNPDTGDYADGIPAELRDEIDISAIYTRQLNYSSVGKAAARAAALPAGPAIAVNPPQEPDIDTARKYAPLIQSWEQREEDVVSFLMQKDKIPYEASEAFQSITTRIALDAAEEAANWNIPYDIIATPDRIEALWKLSDTYREEYATGKHEYNSSKIELTVNKAISAGRAKYEELVKRRAPAADEFIEEEEAEPEFTPDDRAAELEKQALRMDEIAAKCGPVINGMYQYYIKKLSLIYQPEIALFVALWAIGTICGRVWEAESIHITTQHCDTFTPPTTTTDYLTILANTGTGKESIKTALRKFLEHLEIPTPSNVTINCFIA